MKIGSTTTSGGERKLDRRAQIVHEYEAESSSFNRLVATPEVGEMLMMKK